MQRPFALGLVVLLGGAPVAADSCDPADFAGRWVGQATAPSEDTDVVLDVGPGGSALTAAMSLPDVGVSGWPAMSVTLDGCSVRLELPSDSGPQIMSLHLARQVLAGTWTDSRLPEPASLTLVASKQLPQPEERILVDGPVGKLGVSILAPEGDGPFPAVVFLHGSGPQPRDASRFLALALARHGVAAAIFDKRGVGESEGELAGATFQDLAADGIAVARALLARPEISAVGFFGHSQGGWIGPMAAATWEDAAFVISSAGPAVPPSREGEWTSVRALRKAGAGEPAVTAARRVIRLWHDGLRSGDWSAFDDAFARAKKEPWFAEAGLEWMAERPDPGFARLYRAFMDYDPLPALRRLEAPMLAILSPDDESIDAVETEGILRKLAASGRDIAIRLYPGYDHTLRRLGSAGEPLRWPEHPEDYIATLAGFARASAGALEH